MAPRYRRLAEAAGRRVMLTAGLPGGAPGATNLPRIAWLGELEDHRKTPRGE